MATFDPAPGTHVVIGGTGGFGFETALWLLERGAERVVVASRGGVIAGDDRARAAPHAQRLVALPLDVTDPLSVRAFMIGLRARYGSIAGVIHTAMVLDDGLISGMSTETLHAVLGPKVSGIAALDEATREDDLQYFVAYSSATTLIGNPGQAAYILANAYMEGFMRRRRAAGKPGLAVAWGAIADAGIIARDAALGERLARTTGVAGVRACDAIAHLGHLLAGGADGPVAIYSAIGRSAIADQLSILRTPAFAALRHREETSGDAARMNLEEVLAGLQDENAIEMLVEVTRNEIGRILQLDAGSIDRTLPLGEIGMDSLMALELRLSVEKGLGVELPLLSLADKTVLDVAAKILAGMRARQAPGSAEDGPQTSDVAGLAVSLAAVHGTSDEIGLEIAELMTNRNGNTTDT